MMNNIFLKLKYVISYAYKFLNFSLFVKYIIEKIILYIRRIYKDYNV